MNKNNRIIGVTIAIGIIAFGIGNWIVSSREGTLKALIARLVAAGAHEYASANGYLEEAVATGDRGKILRAFSEVAQGRLWSMDKVIPALQSYGSDSSGFVRLNAGRGLLEVGDKSGRDILLALVQLSDPIEGINGDMRIDAAESLAQFRQEEATPAIYNLYEKTNEPRLIRPLILLRYNGLPTILEPLRFIISSLAFEEYGQAGATKFAPQIEEVFQKTDDLQLKVASAWALATLTRSEAATEYLLSAGKTWAVSNAASPSGATNGGRPKALWNRDAVRFLGSIQTTAAKAELEDALSSPYPEVVRLAAVNLVFNLGGSQRVNDLLVKELNGETNSLGTDVTLNLAVHLNDPRINAAGQNFAKTDGSGLWALYTVERRNWPIYNWIDEFVVNLKK